MNETELERMVSISETLETMKSSVLSKALENYRKSGLSVRAAAEKCWLNYCHFFHITKGDKHPTVETIVKIATFFA